MPLNSTLISTDQTFAPKNPCTYRAGIEFWDLVTCVINERIRPASLLVDDAQEVSRVIRKWSLRLLGESLDAAERCILVMNYLSLR